MSEELKAKEMTVQEIGVRIVNAHHPSSIETSGDFWVLEVLALTSGLTPKPAQLFLTLKLICKSSNSLVDVFLFSFSGHSSFQKDEVLRSNFCQVFYSSSTALRIPFA